MFEEKLQQAFANLQIPCTSDQAAQCARYFAMLVEANQTMNLTNVTQEDEAIPVSYTHLDVYKRQVLPCLLGAGRWAASLSRSLRATQSLLRRNAPT